MVVAGVRNPLSETAAPSTGAAAGSRAGAGEISQAAARSKKDINDSLKSIMI